jgi:tetratricopeptide (TPR) repeat protein
MKFCHQCGYQLTLGTERFCSECGQNLEQKLVGRKDDDDKSTVITDTKGDVFGAGISGSGNFIGKEVAYTVQGNILNFNISGGSISSELVEQFQKMLAVPTQLESQTSPSKRTTKDNVIKQEEATKQQIDNVLNELNKIEDKSGTKIQEIKAGDLQISRKELLLKESRLKANIYYYKEEYDEAIKCYDKVLEIDPNDIFALNNKGLALDDLGKHDEAIKCYDKVLEIDPNYAAAVWYNKGLALYHLGNYNEAIKCYDKALEIDPSYINALINKGNALCYLSNYNEAIKCYDKVLEIDPNHVGVLNNKELALEKIKKKKGWFR